MPPVPRREKRRTKGRQQGLSSSLLSALLVAAATTLAVSGAAAAARPLVAAASTPTPTAASPSSSPSSSSPPTENTTSSSTFNPTILGPCSSSAVATTTLKLDPLASGCKGAGCVLTVTVTAGGGNNSATTDPAPAPSRCTRPLPLVLVIPGFSARASMYSPYVEMLASWGYATVQYEAPLLASFPPLRDAYEGSPAFASLVAQAATEAAEGSGAFTIDPKSALKPMAVGHSRGGKIVALMLASGAVSTAALLDPVDGGFTSLFPPKPSAVVALRAAPADRKRAVVVQAGVQGLCNGAIVGGDSLFWNALVGEGGAAAAPAAQNQWRTVLPKAGHGSLAELGVFQPIAGLVCGGKVKFGGLPESKAIELARTVVMEWVEKSWTGGGDGGGGDDIPAEAAFCGFVARERPYMTPVEQGDGAPVCTADAK